MLSLHRAARSIALLRGAVSQASGSLAAAPNSLEQPCSSSSSSTRPYSASEEAKPVVESIGNEKVQGLAAEIMGLTVLEASWLSEILRKKLNIQKPAFGSMPMAMSVAAPAAATATAASEPAPPPEKKEKTEFEVKLASFTTEGKIKVIKEVRAITNLGLKEAKELVEKAPVVIKGGVPKADAETMKKQIEAAGGKVELL